MLNCLSPSTSLKVTSVPPKRSPPLVTPSATGGRPSRNSFSNVPFLWMFDCTSVCDCGGLKSIGRRFRRPEVGRRDGMERFFARQRVDAVLALVVGHEGDLRGLLIAQDDRRHIAGQGVRVLLQLAGFRRDHARDPRSRARSLSRSWQPAHVSPARSCMKSSKRAWRIMPGGSRSKYRLRGHWTPCVHRRAPPSARRSRLCSAVRPVRSLSAR